MPSQFIGHKSSDTDVVYFAKTLRNKCQKARYLLKESVRFRTTTIVSYHTTPLLSMDVTSVSPEFKIFNKIDC